ncbi:MAG: AmmeMemoRadiSam system radical SAM enzyme [Candidatus Aenigmatarchaeota archaeon]
MKEAMFWKSVTGGIQCRLCCRYCVISEGKTGTCRVRQNKGGKLYSLVYGKVAAMNVDSILKKPLFHFAPGSLNLSVSTVGCNFRCSFCCNYILSQEWTDIHGEDAPPEKLVRIAKQNNLQGIAYTYTEPTIFFEYAHDTALLAKKNGLYNVFVTNGYTPPEVIKKAATFLDAAVIDLKSSLEPAFYKEYSLVPDAQPIYDAMLAYKKNKIFIEITNLIMPESKEEYIKKISRWIVENLGPDTPFHLIQFFPSYKMRAPTTSVSLLEKAYRAAKEQGLNYVYLGNVPGSKYESTYCPKCGQEVIGRYGPRMTEFLLKDMKCPCGEKIPVAGEKWIPKEMLKKVGTE